MKRRRMVLTLVLALFSNSCFLLKTDERVDVVIAATDLGAGNQITDRDITIVAMPVSAVTQDMPRKSSQVVGHTTKVPIHKGALILLSELK
jgi:flagella basal body P-ring formation protein FlgA